MAEQEVAKLKLTFMNDVKQEDIQLVTSFVDVMERLNGLKMKDTLSPTLNSMSKSLKTFQGISIKQGMGKGITNLTDTINALGQVKDITPYAANLDKGFAVLSSAAGHFQNINAKIPVGLGRGMLGLVNAANEITKVKDISPVARLLDSNFKIISQATKHFDNMKSADYTGISRLVSAMGQFGDIKPIDNTVVDNAKKLAVAINTLDKDVTGSTTRLQALGQVSRQVGNSFKQSSTGVDRFGGSLKLINFAIVIRAIRTVTNALRGLMRQLFSTVTEFGNVQNTMSFFSQSLGTEATKTADIIQQYASMGAVDFTQFADQTAKLNQMYKGYGINAADAAKMALNMTQLAYDASYALGENGKDIDLWMQRATSFSTGQTRSGYFFGVDASVTALRQEFDGLTSSSDKATRALAAYELILKNTTPIQGQLAREFGNSYVQMQVFNNRVRQLKQSIGAALVPAFQEVIRWGLVTLKVIERVIDAIVRVFGGEGFKLINYKDMIGDIGDGMGGVADSSVDIGDGMKEATKQAKEFKKTITGIDQVFTINDNKDTGGSPVGGGNMPGGIGGGVGGYDWLEDLASMENLKALSDIDAAADKVVATIKRGLPFVTAFGAGLLAFKFAKGFMDSLKWINGTKDIFGGLGLDKLAFGIGFPLFLLHLNDLRLAVEDIMANGFNFDRTAALLSSFAGTVGGAFALMGNFNMAGAMFGIQGILDVVRGIKDITDVGVNFDNATTVIKGLGGIAIAIGLLKGNWAAVGTGMIMQGGVAIIREIVENWDAIKQGDWSGVDKVTIFTGALAVLGGVATALGLFKKTVDTANAGGTLTKAAESTQTLSTATGGVSSKLTGMVKNLGMAIVIMVEVAILAAIFTGTIWGLGIALTEIGKAWAPVIADGKNIALGVTIGTALLVGIGIAAFALGSATIASAGTIPLAIAAGTAMALLIGGATILFAYELVIVANVMANELSPAMRRLNEVMPTLSSDMGNFTFFMIEFAGHVVAYTAASAVGAFAGAVDTIVGWFTKDPIKKMADDATKNGVQFQALKSALETTNPLAQKSSDLMLTYVDLLKKLKSTTDIVGTIGSPTNIGVSFKDFSRSLKDGFADLQNVRTTNVANIMAALNSLDLNKFKGIGTSIVKSMELGMTSYQFNLSGIVTKITAGLTFDAKSIGNGVANTYSQGINNAIVNLTSFTNRIKTGLTFSGTSLGGNIGASVVSGINSASVYLGTFTSRISSNLNVSTYSIGSDIARGVQNGINNFYPNVSLFTERLKRNMRVSFEVRSPSRWAKRVIGNMIGLGTVGGINETDINLNPFKRNIGDAVDDMDLSPRVNMPTFDTRQLNGDISRVSAGLSAKINSQLNVDNDSAERAIGGLTEVTIMLFEQLIEAVKDGKDIYIDRDKIGSTVEEYIRNNKIRLNTPT